MDYKVFKKLSPLDQIISISGVNSSNSMELKRLLALVNLIARGATGDSEQSFVDETIRIIFNGEENGK